MSEIMRSQPQIIEFGGGIQADSPGGAVNFTDMLNLVPPSDGSGGLTPRPPVTKSSTYPAGGGVFKVTPGHDTDAIGTQIVFQPLLSIVSPNGEPVALFPIYDVVNTLPGDWENVQLEYSKPGADPGPVDPPEPPITDCSSPGYAWSTVVGGLSNVSVNVPLNTSRIVLRFRIDNIYTYKSEVRGEDSTGGVFFTVSSSARSTAYIDPSISGVSGPAQRVTKLKITTYAGAVDYYFIPESP